MNWYNQGPTAVGVCVQGHLQYVYVCVCRDDCSTCVFPVVPQNMHSGGFNTIEGTQAQPQYVCVCECREAGDFAEPHPEAGLAAGGGCDSG